MTRFYYTRYFEICILVKRPYLKKEWCEAIVANPEKREAQPDGRIRFWGFVSERNSYIRVVTLDDGVTIHNAFPDRRFKK